MDVISTLIPLSPSIWAQSEFVMTWDQKLNIGSRGGISKTTNTPAEGQVYLPRLVERGLADGFGLRTQLWEVGRGKRG